MGSALPQPYRFKGQQQGATDGRTVHRPSSRLPHTGFDTLSIQCFPIRIDDLEPGGSKGREANGLRWILCYSLDVQVSFTPLVLTTVPKLMIYVSCIGISTCTRRRLGLSICSERIVSLQAVGQSAGLPIGSSHLINLEF